MSPIQNLAVLAVGAVLFGIRLRVTTVGHSWTLVFLAAAHIFVGVMLTLLWQKRGRWLIGWIALMTPSLLELAMFEHWIPGLP